MIPEQAQRERTGMNVTTQHGVYSAELGARRPEISASVDQLHGATERLAGVVAELIGRLSPVLSPEAGASGNQACTTTSCPLASELQAATDRVFLIEARVVSLLHRLEI